MIKYYNNLMINFRTSRKHLIVHSGSQSPSKFQNISKKPSVLVSTFMETHSKSFKSLDKQACPTIFPYKVKETFITSTKSTRNFSAKRLSVPDDSNKPTRSLSKKCFRLHRVKTSSSLSPTKDHEHEQEQEQKSNLSYKLSFPKSEKGVFQEEEFVSPALEFYTELSENTRENIKKINRNSLNLFKEVQSGIDEMEIKEYKSKYLSEQDLKNLLEQYDLPQVLRDFDLIDSLVGKLDFFMKFYPDIRKRIYAYCQVGHFLPGQYIFKQGDIGDNVYVILKGSVSIEKTLTDLASFDIIVNSIYDGKHFGDLSLLSHLLKQPNKLRQASCISSEDSYFFIIPKDNYAEILFSVQKSEIEEKISFFSNVNLFKGLPLSSISNIATNVTVKEYELDDIILKQGEIPKGLYIIISGYAVLYTQGFRLQGNKTKFHNATRKKYSKDLKKRKESSIIQRALINNLGPVTPRTLDNLKTFVSQEEAEKGLVTREWMEFVSIHSKEYFGGRVLLQANDQHPSLASKFTVKAKSAKLKLFLIDKFHLQHFSDEVVQQVKTILAKSYEVDCPPDVNPDRLTQDFQKWLGYKANLAEQINESRFLTRHRNEYPYIRK